MARPRTVREFVERHAPQCLEDGDAATEAHWLRDAHRQLSSVAQEAGFDTDLLRRSTWRALQQSASRVDAASQACAGIDHMLPSGVWSVLVAGSAARGEAVATSDLDFNVYVSPEYLNELYVPSKPGTTPGHRQLKTYESRLRDRIEPQLLHGLGHSHYRHSDAHLTLKPFSHNQLAERDDAEIAVMHLVNLMFGATAVWGQVAFEELLAELLSDPQRVAWGVLGRLALLRKNRELGAAYTARTNSDNPVLRAAHGVAAAIATILTSGLTDGDPQVPYWACFEELPAVLDHSTRARLGGFLAQVTLARGGDIPNLDVSALGRALENAVGTLAGVVDAIIDRLTGSADDMVLEAWEEIGDCLEEPERLAKLAGQMGLSGANSGSRSAR